MFVKIINENDVTSRAPNYFGTHIGILNLLECLMSKNFNSEARTATLHGIIISLRNIMFEKIINDI